MCARSESGARINAQHHRIFILRVRLPAGSYDQLFTYSGRFEKLFPVISPLLFIDSIGIDRVNNALCLIALL